MKHTRIKLGSARAGGTMGTFAGVFTPSVLTILGIILFRRTGYVVGAGGLGQALVIIAMANTISVLTSLSLSAVATNLRVKGGGDYYIISRTLGVEFGGAIGAVLFLAQSVSIAFYCIGFGEVVGALLPWQHDLVPRVVAALALGFLLALAWLGADWATRFQYVVMAFLGAALVSFFAGGLWQLDTAVLATNWAVANDGPGLWVVFAIFFPAVTGFTQGVSMSGDLKDPGRSLPRGTFAAVALSCLVYVGVACVLAANVEVAVLRGDYGVMNHIALVPWLVDAGIIAATLSSGMASFLGAPRILQALAKDHVFPGMHWFAKGHGASANPRRGVLLSAVIAFLAVAFLGDLNRVAPVVSMFFLISYGLLNYATYYEARAASPSFRPRFKFFDKRLSLLGALGCLGAILAIHPTAGVLSATLLFGIYQYIKRTAGPSRWADSSRSYLFQRIREHLFALASGTEHPRDWRPQILALAKDDGRREQTLRFASWIEGGSGLTSAVDFLEKGEGDVHRRREEATKELSDQIQALGLQAFPLVITTPDVKTGLEQLLQGYGVGPLRANIVLLNWLEQVVTDDDASEKRAYGRYLREAIRLGRNLVVLDAEAEEWERLLQTPLNQRRIDVWWWGGASSRLALLLAYLSTRTDEWKDARIRVIAQGGKKAEKVSTRLAQMLEDIRIEAMPEAVEKIDADVMVDMSRDAALVFLPLWLRGTTPSDPFGHPPEKLLADLPVVALIAAAEDIELAAEADKGKPAEIAESVDRAEASEKKAQRAEKEASKSIAAAEAAVAELEEAQEAVPGNEAKLEAAQSRAQETQAEAKRAEREAERARAEAVEAARVAESMGGPAGEGPKPDA